MNQPLSRIVFNPDTTDELNHLLRQLEPHMDATRSDRIETTTVTRYLDDTNGDVEVMLYVFVYTGNLLDMICSLAVANLL